METINLTPTWRSAFKIYLAICEQEWSKPEGPDREVLQNAVLGLYEAADHLDRINKERKDDMLPNEEASITD